MAIERFWERQGPIAFTADGGEDGLVTVGNVACFKVKQKIVISSTTEPDLPLEVKRVVSFTQLYVGPIKSKQVTGNSLNNMKLRADLTAYLTADSAMIRAVEQSKNTLKVNDIIQAVYEQEPTLAIRNFNVDKIGNGYTVENPFPTLISDGDDTLAINPDGSINVVVTTGTAGTPVIYTEPSTFTDTVETTVATYTSGADNTRINRLLGEAATFGIWKMYKTSVAPGNLKAVKRTSFSERTADLTLEQAEVADDTEKIIITFQAQRYRSHILGASADTFVRLEGLIP